MLKALLYLRVKQLTRLVAGLPLLYSCFLLILLAVALALCVQWLSQPTQAIVVAAVACAMLLYVHLSRTDKHFVRLISSNPRLLYVGEYVFLTMPVSLLLALAGSWQLALAFMLTILLASMWVGDARSVRLTLSLARFAPAHSIEWMAGLRRYGAGVAILWLASVGLLAFPFASFAPLLMLLLTVCGFYGECESAQLLALPQLSASALLKRKMLTALSSFFTLALPVLLLYPLLHCETAWLVPLFAFIASLGLCFAIVVKYGLYQPDSKRTTSGMILAVGFMGLLLPLGLPLTLALTAKYYLQSKQTLNTYLYAYR